MLERTFLIPCKSILVVDDDEKVGNTLAAILRQAGYRVVNVRLICDAIDSLATDCFDLVLLDPKMPDLAGHAFLANLHVIYPKLPVLVLTAYLSMDTTGETERSGKQRVLLKPEDPGVLLDCIDEILSSPHSLQH